MTSATSSLVPKCGKHLEPVSRTEAHGFLKIINFIFLFIMLVLFICLLVICFHRS